MNKHSIFVSCALPLLVLSSSCTTFVGRGFSDSFLGNPYAGVQIDTALIVGDVDEDSDDDEVVQVVDLGGLYTEDENVPTSAVPSDESFDASSMFVGVVCMPLDVVLDTCFLPFDLLKMASESPAVE